jgi:hypothetical protein
VTAQPPPERLYFVRAVITGDATDEAIQDLSKRLNAKGAENLRQRCSALRVDRLQLIGCAAAEMTATVNDWNAGAAAMRVVTLLTLKAGPGWDVIGMSVSAGVSL